MKNTITHIPFLKWLLFNTTVSVMLIAAHYFGLLQLVLDHDPTKLTVLIFALFVITVFYCGNRTLFISRQLNITNTIRHLLEKNSRVNKDTHEKYKQSECIKHFDDVNQVIDSSNKKHIDQIILLQCQSTKLHNKNEIIWQISDTLINLGLIGTVIGFILALWPLFTLTDFSFDNVRSLLGDISGGMAVALFTTLVGITTSTLVKIQAHFLETSTNSLLSQIAYITETRVIPTLLNK